MDTHDKYFNDEETNKQSSAKASSDKYSTERRKVLKTMVKLAYVAPILTVISLPKNASAIGSPPFPGGDEPLDPNDPRLM